MERPQLLVMPAAPGQFVFQLQGQTGATYYSQSSSNLTSWTSFSTNTLSGPTLKPHKLRDHEAQLFPRCLGTLMPMDRCGADSVSVCICMSGGGAPLASVVRRRSHAPVLGIIHHSMNVMSAPIRTTLMAALLGAASLVSPCAQAQQSDAQTNQLALLRAQAEKGDAQAQSKLADAYFLGSLGLEKNAMECVKWLRKAAAQDFANAQLNLGNCYLKGQGVEKDVTEAMKWYRKAAEQNVPEAQYNLGVGYRDG